MSRQAYYRMRKRNQWIRRVELVIVDWVRMIRSLMPELGAKKIYERWGEALPYGRDKFLDLMRRKQLLIPHKPACAPRTTYASSRPGLANLFMNLVLWRAGQAVVSDITYVRLQRGHCYLSLVTDAFSKKIVGWYVAATLEAAGSIAALKRAIATYGSTAGLLHHSDRGIQYLCMDYGKQLKRAGMRQSVTMDDHCAENALAECINGILKREFGLGGRFHSIHQVRRVVSEAIYIYNHYRPNRAMGHRTPDEVHYNKTITTLNFCQPI